MPAAYAACGHLDVRVLADSVGDRFGIVDADPGRPGDWDMHRTGELPAHDVPAAWCRQPGRMLAAEVVAVRFVHRGKGSHQRLLLGVHVGQRRDGSISARGARTSAGRAHGRDSSRPRQARPSLRPHVARVVGTLP